MIPRAFEYHDPDSPEDVLALLGKYGDEGKLMAGGQSLLPMMKLRLASPAHVIDLWRVRGLDTITERDGEIRIGGLATHRALEDSTLLRAHCPLLAKAAATIGDPQVRNLGTIGGSIAHADPSANYPPALVALGAKFVLHSKTDERVVAAGEFFKGLFQTELRPTELLTEVRVPALGAGVGWEFLKLSRRASDFALVSVAVLVYGKKDATFDRADVVLGSVGPVPTRAAALEADLRGKRVDRLDTAEAGRSVVLGPNTLSDVHADAAYRKEVAPICVGRALQAAVARMTSRR
jgi:carbon-monoxide dehydrogenase medium subunit